MDIYGNRPGLTLIPFNLDETTYARELAPLAGHYPAVKIGPPWWFHDSLNDMKRYFDRVVRPFKGDWCISDFEIKLGLFNTVKGRGWTYSGLTFLLPKRLL